MAFAWGDAAGGAQKAQVIQAQLQNQLAELAFRQAQEQRIREQMGMEQKRFEVEQQAREGELSDQRNQRGLRMMAGDAVDQYPNEPQKYVGSLIRAGMSPPASLLGAQTAAPEQFTLGEGQIRYDAQGNVIARGNERPASTTAGGFTLGTGQTRYDAEGKVIARGREPQAAQEANGGATPTDPASVKFLQDTANRTISAIDDVLPDIGYTTAGTLGSVLSNIPGTSAANVSAELAAVASNVAFNALQQMRAASKTGGALGQVSERELDLLSSVEGSIRQNQSPANLKAQLQKVRESMVRIQQAAGGGAAAPGAVRWGRDANGKPVRLQ